MLWEAPVRGEQSHATVLNAEEISCVLQASQSNLAARRAQQTRDSPRDAAALALAHIEWFILVLLFTVGTRDSELCMLKLQDVSIEVDLIRLHLLAKSGRSLSPLIHPKAGKVLFEYIRTLRGCVASRSQKLKLKTT